MWCDEYFWLAHRNEPRGTGGIFYDHHDSGDYARDFAFTCDVGTRFLDAYSAIVAGRMSETGERIAAGRGTSAAGQGFLPLGGAAAAARPRCLGWA